MRFVYFTHSLRSCWNHGNAHFLRGVLRELLAQGHEVAAYEPTSPWSVQNLVKDHGEAGLKAFHDAYPELGSRTYEDFLELDLPLSNADVVIVHEWNEPWLVAALGRKRRRGARFTLLFHDTHHRAVSDPQAIRQFDLDGYDGVLAFGETLAEVYRRWGWGRRVFVWHEAADTRLFHPPASPLAGEAESRERPREGGGSTSPDTTALPPPPGRPNSGVPDFGTKMRKSETSDLRHSGDSTSPIKGEGERHGLVWIGNWGDDERSAELEAFLLAPAQAVGLPLDIYGVRYPDHALQALQRYGAAYRGWLPNPKAPEVFARHLATVHVPRRFYVDHLPGIPTIRVFEALACGIPLVSAPWRDSEGLFRPGQDFLVAADGQAMERALSALRDDAGLRAALVESGLATIRARHTCAHRAQELLGITAALGASAPLEMTA